MTDQIPILAQIWLKQTGQNLHIRSLEPVLFRFLQAGFTGADLETVLLHIKHLNARSEFKRQLNIRLVLDYDSEFPFSKFGSDLSLADAWKRNQKQPPTPKQVVVQQFSPVMGENVTATATKLSAEVVSRGLQQLAREIK